jgi:hypothetical protein
MAAAANSCDRMVAALVLWLREKLMAAWQLWSSMALDLYKFYAF